MSRRSEYKLSEVRALVEGYAEWRELKSTNPGGGRLNLLLRLADLDRAVKQMPPKEYRAVLLHGLLRLPARAVGEIEGCYHDTILDRYDAGLEWITHHLNGDER